MSMPNVGIILVMQSPSKGTIDILKMKIMLKKFGFVVDRVIVKDLEGAPPHVLEDLLKVGVHEVNPQCLESKSSAYPSPLLDC